MLALRLLSGLKYYLSLNWWCRIASDTLECRPVKFKASKFNLRWHNLVKVCWGVGRVGV